MIATPLATQPHLVAFLETVQAELDRRDPTKLLVYLFDTVDARLLDSLAEQFDMLKYEGWVLAQNDDERRALLKGAITLKRLKGTPAGIREVTQRLGFGGVTLEEGWDNIVGVTGPEPENSWAYFRVKYTLPETKALPPDLVANLAGMIDAYKPARSVMYDFSFVTTYDEVIDISDSLVLNIINV